jgi:hypothetical protein
MRESRARSRASFFFMIRLLDGMQVEISGGYHQMYLQADEIKWRSMRCRDTKKKPASEGKAGFSA